MGPADNGMNLAPQRLLDLAVQVEVVALGAGHRGVADDVRLVLARDRDGVFLGGDRQLNIMSSLFQDRGHGHDALGLVINLLFDKQDFGHGKFPLQKFKAGEIQSRSSLAQMRPCQTLC